MERRFTENNSYCDSATTAGAVVVGCGTGTEDSGPPQFFSATVPIDGGNITYNLTIDAVSRSTFTIRATGVGVMADDECGDFTLTNTGVRNIVDQDAGTVLGDCW
jgi:type IV pilus assembly protein PilE